MKQSYFGVKLMKDQFIYINKIQKIISESENRVTRKEKQTTNKVADLKMYLNNMSSTFISIQYRFFRSQCGAIDGRLQNRGQFSSIPQN